MKDLPVRLCLLPVRIYQVAVSPLLGPRCRYHPTCSSYAADALKKHGPLKGVLLAAGRIMRCHPWAGCHWHDPVREQFAWRDIIGYKREQNSKTSSR